VKHLSGLGLTSAGLPETICPRSAPIGKVHFLHINGSSTEAAARGHKLVGADASFCREPRPTARFHAERVIEPRESAARSRSAPSHVWLDHSDHGALAPCFAAFSGFQGLPDQAAIAAHGLWSRMPCSAGHGVLWLNSLAAVSPARSLLWDRRHGGRRNRFGPAMACCITRPDNRCGYRISGHAPSPTVLGALRAILHRSLSARQSSRRKENTWRFNIGGSKPRSGVGGGPPNFGDSK